MYQLWELAEPEECENSIIEYGWVTYVYQVPWIDCTRGAKFGHTIARALCVTCPIPLREELERRHLGGIRGIFSSRAEFLEFKRRWEPVLVAHGYDEVLLPHTYLMPVVWQFPRRPEPRTVYWPVVNGFIQGIIVPRSLAQRFVRNGVTNVTFYDVIRVPSSHYEADLPDVVEYLRELRRGKGSERSREEDVCFMAVTCWAYGYGHHLTKPKVVRCSECGMACVNYEDEPRNHFEWSARLQKAYQAKSLVPMWKALSNADVFQGFCYWFVVNERVKHIMEREKIKNVRFSPVEFGVLNLDS